MVLRSAVIGAPDFFKNIQAKNIIISSHPCFMLSVSKVLLLIHAQRPVSKPYPKIQSDKFFMHQIKMICATNQISV
jgi:hypothetical protein